MIVYPYKKWEELGRRVRRFEKPIAYDSRNYALYHIGQTEPK